MRMMHLFLLPLGNHQRLQPHASLPAHDVSSPIDPVDPPLSCREPQRLEQLHVDVDALGIAAHALVDNLDVLDRLLVVGVVDVDGGAAEGVVVRVRGGELEVRDGDDELAGCGADVAGGILGVGGGGVVG